MHIHINHHSGEPIYRQMVEAIKLRITNGELAEGTRLPSIREMAAQLEINARTVSRAYEVLDKEGLVVLQQGRGVFVTSPQATVPTKQRRPLLMEQIRRLLAEATRMGASREEVLQIMQNAMKEMWGEGEHNE